MFSFIVLPCDSWRRVYEKQNNFDCVPADVVILYLFFLFFCSDYEMYSLILKQ